MKVFREPVYPEWPELKEWCEQQLERKESDRVFASLGQKQQTQQRPQRQVSNVRQRKSNERPKSFNHYFSLLTAEREEKRRIEEEEFEQEQKILEQKWRSQRDSSYAIYT